MKPVPMFFLVFTLTFVATFIFTQILDLYSGSKDSEVARMRAEVDVLTEEIEQLRAQNSRLTEMVEAQRGKGDMVHAPEPREPIVGVEEAVDRWIRAHRPDLLPMDTKTPSPETQGLPFQGTKYEQAAQLLALLNDPELDDQGWNEVWKKISDAGLMDEALAVLEDNVARDPTNADAHVALAGGYIGKTMNTANDMEKGVWAIKADQTLDSALELNPYHWDARFTKAISLTFYPPVMGKQGEAIKHFEILLDQQKKLTPDPKHAQTYLFLGNLHQQMGNFDKASQIWNDGISRYPGNAELAAQLKNALKQ